MHDGLADALQRFEGACDQVLARLCQHLDGDVVGDPATLDQAAHEIEFGLRGGGKSDLDFLEADLQQHVVEAQLLFDPHGVGERLVAVAQVGRDPARRGGDLAGRPLPVGQMNRGLERAIFRIRIAQHHDDGPEFFAWCLRGGAAGALTRFEQSGHRFAGNEASDPENCRCGGCRRQTSGCAAAVGRPSGPTAAAKSRRGPARGTARRQAIGRQ